MNPWENEPDFGSFTDDATGYPFVIVRHPTIRHLCGYVGLPEGHPWHGKGYDHCRLLNDDWPEVHGGLTYAARAAPKQEPDGRWWIGFDCAHTGDFSPGLGCMSARDFEVYRTWDYVARECASLAAQAQQYANACIACEMVAP